MKIAIIDDYKDVFLKLDCAKKLAGHELVTFTDTEKAPAKLAARLQDADIVVLSHSPDQFVDMPPGPALMIAAHSHCGQVTIPLASRLALPIENKRNKFPLKYGGIP